MPAEQEVVSGVRALECGVGALQDYQVLHHRLFWRFVQQVFSGAGNAGAEGALGERGVETPRWGVEEVFVSP